MTIQRERPSGICASCGHPGGLHYGPEGVCVANCTSVTPLVQCGCKTFVMESNNYQSNPSGGSWSRIDQPKDDRAELQRQLAALQAENERLKAATKEQEDRDVAMYAEFRKQFDERLADYDAIRNLPMCLKSIEYGGVTGKQCVEMAIDRAFNQGRSEVLKRAEQAEQEIERLRERAIKAETAARVGIEGDNHHNAARCPYCNPDWERHRELISRAERAEAELTRLTQDRQTP
jgi:hypothetical protein